MFADFAIISILLVIAHLLRSRIRFLQYLLIPAPILAGFLGLAGGPQFLDLLPFSLTAEGKLAMDRYPYELIAILFATLFLGHQPRRPSLKTMLRDVGDTWFYNFATYIGQYGIALLFGLFVLPYFFPDLNPGFALMMPAGFAGGHGTATAVSESLQAGGFEDALSLGYTFATIGLLTGIFGGLLLINIATRFGWTHLVKSAQDLPESTRSGFLPPEEQSSLGTNTVSAMSLDPLTWHFAIVMAAFGGAHGVDYLFRHVLESKVILPLFAVSLLVSAILQMSLELCQLGKYVDRQVMSRIGSSVSDYLIAFAVASIKISVVVEYLAPLIVMSLLGFLYAVAMLWFLGRHLFHNFWFERSIFAYGWMTGVVGIGVLLLRIVDPNLKSKTLQDYGLAFVGISPLEILLIVAVPPLVAQQIILAPALVIIIVAIACFCLSVFLVGWFRTPPSQLRSGEQEIIDDLT
ncbi:sodium/glutamate symporter [Gimesia algae]|uniref:Sodium/glutamate symporter n=1 Tax=Gimesia algae TaxID=2527971 RepID=A0A517VDR0_9PLAN|nr:sodium/glutamate symporter [Gimesia algae]QDT91138.1 Sodium/glutamate symporter [Gimesia algae]